MSLEEKTKLAASYKTKATPCIHQEVCCCSRNRVAFYVNMTPLKCELVVQDCDEVSKLDPTFVKALDRRALACKALPLHRSSRSNHSQDCVVLDNLPPFPSNNSVPHDFLVV
ncbi:hypothetical protein R3P38DRAFT_3030910 [Favolaschia claudopus]|uniref:Uncharacterized protein n=1 Tax=Favolaschia claudopus TaxID=2862362 RepID=A0AAW0ADZ2_9AGAR